jgi:hypothetical protein
MIRVLEVLGQQQDVSALAAQEVDLLAGGFAKAGPVGAC